MTLTARIVVVGLSLLLFLVVLRLARRRVLGLEYSILWLVLTGCGVLAGQPGSTCWQPLPHHDRATGPVPKEPRIAQAPQAQDRGMLWNRI